MSELGLTCRVRRHRKWRGDSPTTGVSCVTCSRCGVSPSIPSGLLEVGAMYRWAQRPLRFGAIRHTMLLEKESQ